ncbi:MAG TPA: hypothetical protein VG389_12155 [Myxococcota bacterium]|nr:hypothetical protein [Myxococcota bacterium]
MAPVRAVLAATVAPVAAAAVAALACAACTPTDRPLLDQPSWFPAVPSLAVPRGAAGDEMPLDVPTNVLIRVQMNGMPVVAATVNDTTVRLESGSAALPATVTYDVMDNEVVVAPAAELPADALVEVVVGTGVISDPGPGAAGVGLADDARLPFRTGAGPDSVAPTFAIACDATAMLCADGVTACTTDADCPLPFTVFPEEIGRPRPYVLRANVDRRFAADDKSSASELSYVAYVATAPGAQDFAGPRTDLFDMEAVGATHRLLRLDRSTDYYVVIRALDAAGNESENTVEVGPVRTGDLPDRCICPHRCSVDATCCSPTSAMPCPAPQTCDEVPGMCSIDGTPCTTGGVECPTRLLWNEAYLSFGCHECLNCHGTSAEAAPEGMYMPQVGVDPYDWIVGVPSREMPTLRRVEPFNAARSYIVLKRLGKACSAFMFGAGTVGMDMPASTRNESAPCVPVSLECCSSRVGDLTIGSSSDFLAWIDLGAPQNGDFSSFSCGE